MPIRWDALLVRHTARELHARLTGARLRAVRLDGDGRDLALLFRETTLVWRLHPTRGYPLLFPPRELGETDLRLSSTLVGIEGLPDERVLCFRLSTRRGAERRAEVIVELLGNQWNAVVTTGEQRRIRHVLLRREKGARPLLPGLPWRAPDTLSRQGVGGSPAGIDWGGILADAGKEEAGRVRTRLISSVAWTSPINAGYLLGEDSPPAPSRVAARWGEVADPMAEAKPVLLDLERGVQPYPFPLPGTPSIPCDTLLSALEQCASRQEATQSPAPLMPAGLVRALESALNRARRRVDSLRAEMEGLPDPEASTAIAHLLLARYGEIRRGSAEAVIEGFDGAPVHVALDPALSVQDNAAAYYDRAARSRRAAARLPGLLGDAERNAEQLEALVRDARAGTVDEERARAALPRRGPERKRRGAPATSLPYHRFESSGGLEIRVGRGARHNDALTFHHAAPGDAWLHARDAAGAHVVLRWNGPGSPPARDLAEAAGLAALNSRARTSGTVPVDWTLRKYVRKPRGAAPGAVLPERVRTLFVHPDPSLLDTLKPRPTQAPGASEAGEQRGEG